MHWHQIFGSVWQFEDSCNVYAVAGPGGMVLINSGTGLWLDWIDELPGEVRAVLCTHFFRDHSSGAVAAARKSIPIYAPYWEQEQFADPLGLFQRRETFIIYDNVWDLFSPIEPIPVTGWLKDWDEISLAGLTFRVVPTPGVTPGAISLICQAGDRRVAFSGELIHSPGKMARIAPLQYNYNDLPGAIPMIYSTRLLRAEGIDVLAPSLGEPMLADTDAALNELEDNLRFALSGRTEYKEHLDVLDADPLVKVSEHVYQSAVAGASTWFLISETGKVLTIDYGYHWFACSPPSYPYPRHRRCMLHGLDGLKQQFGIDRIDVALITHFHDDHVNGVPTLQRLFGTRCWAGDNFAHILADPMGYNFPCTWPEPIEVEAKPLGEPIEWEEFSFTLYPMSGHTRWSTLVIFEADGLRFAATGDQVFFLDDQPPAGVPCKHNEVYRNGAVLESFNESTKLLDRIRPDMILPGHGQAYRTGDEFFEKLHEYSAKYVELHRRIMPLGPDDVHFDVDSRAGWLAPYRTRTDSAAELSYTATIRNPLNRPAELCVKLVGPEGWQGSSTKVPAPARAEVSVKLTISPPAGTTCRRQPIAMELTVADRPFGQIAEALVTIGCPVF